MTDFVDQDFKIEVLEGELRIARAQCADLRARVAALEEELAWMLNTYRSNQ